MSQKSAAAKDGHRPSSKGSKSKGGFIARQAAKKVKEADLVAKKEPITPEDVLGLETATTGKPSGPGGPQCSATLKYCPLI